MFCPDCHAEYRPGFTQCAHCDTALVESLEIETLSLEDGQPTLPVGLSSSTELARPVEIEGKVYDLMRVFTLDSATEVQKLLTNRGFPVVLVPVDALFPDQRPRFEVRVKQEDHESAETTLRDHWAKQVEVEGTGAEKVETPVEDCPACGAHVPLEAEECPDCGLFVGSAEDEDADDEDADDEDADDDDADDEDADDVDDEGSADHEADRE